MTEALTVSVLAKRTGVPSRTIRYWEKRGLLPKAERSHTGYRFFGAEGVQYVEFIRKAKGIGLTLSEIRTALALSRAGRNPCPEVARWVVQKAEAVDQQIRLLRQLQARLQKLSRDWSGRSGRNCYRPAELCCLIEGLQIVNKDWRQSK
jgi:DNA-binding transcriptional MerR regulator